jgi:hypothetical protein
LKRYVYCNNLRSKPGGVYVLRRWSGMFCFIELSDWRFATRCHEAFRSDVHE